MSSPIAESVSSSFCTGVDRGPYRSTGVRFCRGACEYEISIADGGMPRRYLGMVDGRPVAEGSDKGAVLAALLIIGAEVAGDRLACR